MSSVNMNKLKAKIVERGMTVTTLADAIGMDRTTLYRKMSNGCATMMVKDANSIVSVLELSVDEAVAIFFNPSVA